MIVFITRAGRYDFDWSDILTQAKIKKQNNNDDEISNNDTKHVVCDHSCIELQDTNPPSVLCKINKGHIFEKTHTQSSLLT